MTIHFASDHAGYELKNALIAYVRDELGYAVVDHGAYTYNESDDYTDFIQPAMGAVVADSTMHRGIILGGSGQGEAICANRVKGIRAALYYGGDERILTLSREHNDANVLSLGARFLNGTEARHAVELWLKTPFSGDERHVRRIAKLS